MKRFSITIIIILFKSLSYGQVDSTFHLTINNQYTYDRASTNGSVGKIYSNEVILKKKNQTIVPTYRRRSLNDTQASQFGISAYRSLNKSYLHVATYHSGGNTFPEWNFLADYFHSIGKGLEFHLAYDQRFYSDETRSNMAIVGLTYERDKNIYKYNVYQSFDDKLSHQLRFKKMLKSRNDFVELSYTNGQNIIETNFDRVDQQLTSYSIHAGKSIQDKMTLNLSSTLSDLSEESDNTIYVGYSFGMSIVIK